MSAKNSADSSEKGEDFEGGNAPGATPERKPLDFGLVNGLTAPPGQMVQDLTGWQAQQQDQDMTGQSTSASPQLPSSGAVRPGEIDNEREQIWRQFMKANPKIQLLDQSQEGTMTEEGVKTPYMAPRLQNFPFDSIEELAEDMRHNGLRWRHNLRERVADDPNLKRLLDWVTYTAHLQRASQQEVLRRSFSTSSYFPTSKANKSWTWATAMCKCQSPSSNNTHTLPRS